MLDCLKCAVHGSLKIHDAKIRHLGTIAQLCQAVSLQLRHALTVGKKLVKQQYLLHVSTIWQTSAHYRLRSVLKFAAPQQISTGFASCLRYYSDIAHRRPTQTFHGVWPSPRLVHYMYIYIFGCPVQNSLCVQVLRSSILAALLHGTPAAGVSQTLQHGTRNGIMVLFQMAPPVSDGRPSRWASAHILV